MTDEHRAGRDHRARDGERPPRVPRERRHDRVTQRIPHAVPVHGTATEAVEEDRVQAEAASANMEAASGT